MKVISLIFSILFLAFSVLSLYLYYAFHAPHFAFIGLASICICYFMIKDLKIKPRKA